MVSYQYAQLSEIKLPLRVALYGVYCADHSYDSTWKSAFDLFYTSVLFFYRILLSRATAPSLTGLSITLQSIGSSSEC